MTDANSKFALVKWVSGADIGKVSIVPQDWIKNFDADMFLEEQLAENHDETYVVEWHDPKQKRPTGGWPVYDGEVLHISDRKSTLERFLKLESSKTQPKPTEFKKKTVEAKENEKEELKTKIKKLENELQTLKDHVVKDLAEVIPEIRSLVKQMKEAPEQKKTKVERVELYAGSEVMVDRIAFEKAESARTLGSFVNCLALNLFGKDVLKNSNLKGGAPKNDTGLPRKSALDSLKLDALRKAAVLKFGGKEGGTGHVGRCLLNLACQLRYKERSLAAFRIFVNKHDRTQYDIYLKDLEK